ncbi:MAG: hypothetical protein UY48_C0008G0004 [Candidatus Gottesmanbacteria bacterium GW2011_GWB1_49_7]|uniref:Uncharacterized protein n=1 Tax=Candidatus Gottesmanbacteria bacterium GW2011_GWB1_49_7 TaxID=1618448 RepID=A0A0G1Z258_9BACT|nr:MAG: hypothetical protein UY48_C0008G0004 [Candidatus Gottesmanbacteria bacterium GW2011_GWB1_49_7]
MRLILTGRIVVAFNKVIFDHPKLDPDQTVGDLMICAEENGAYFWEDLNLTGEATPNLTQKELDALVSFLDAVLQIRGEK